MCVAPSSLGGLWWRNCLIANLNLLGITVSHICLGLMHLDQNQREFVTKHYKIIAYFMHTFQLHRDSSKRMWRKMWRLWMWQTLLHLRWEPAILPVSGLNSVKSFYNSFCALAQQMQPINQRSQELCKEVSTFMEWQHLGCPHGSPVRKTSLLHH